MVKSGSNAYRVNKAGKQVSAPPGIVGKGGNVGARNKKYDSGATDKKKAAPKGIAKKQYYGT